MYFSKVFPAAFRNMPTTDKGAGAPPNHLRTPDISDWSSSLYAGSNLAFDIQGLPFSCLKETCESNKGTNASSTSFSDSSFELYERLFIGCLKTC